jgi:hypothetical protein
MCNLYRMTKTVDEIARLFDVTGESGANFGSEVYPGYRGIRNNCTSEGVRRGSGDGRFLGS